jgi:hypothetical protein
MEDDLPDASAGAEIPDTLDEVQATADRHTSRSAAP